MRWVIAILGVVFFCSVSASAQGPTGAGTGNFGVPRFAGVGVYDDSLWRLSVGFEYNRQNLTGTPFNTQGITVSAARQFEKWKWLGAEAEVGSGLWGNPPLIALPPNLGKRSLFLGGGPRVVYRNRTRYEPWAHVLVGMEHFTTCAASGTAANNISVAAAAGGGVDMFLNHNWAVRLEADAVFTRFLSSNQRSVQGSVGLVFVF